MAKSKLSSFKKDVYQEARGGHSRFLKIICEGCGAFLAIYQKDGPGNLRRMYNDRMFVSKIKFGANASCPECGRVIGTKLQYKKEDRPAVRLYVDSVVKKIISKEDAFRYSTKI